AILVVAFFYGGSINFTLLTIAAVVLLGVWLINRFGEKRMAFYIVPAVIV
ncbi:MAG: Na+/H+ antiporter NhaA, partial [Parabacteroides distasonis]|nr:Na+/H+ antiporter NhaA [Parabacteroides distasonis]